MINANTAGFGVWHVPGRSPLIAYAHPVMDQIADDVIAASRRGRGEETGGLLFGSADDEEVKILAYRALPRRRRAAAFQLTEEDETILRHMLQTSSNDPELRKLVCVGWYHSHIEEPVTLSDEDVRVWDAHFSFRWQVSLLLRPQPDGPIRAGFFFRPLRGQTRTDASLKEFDILPPAPKPALPEAPDPLEDPASARPPDEMFDTPQARPKRWLWYGGGIAAAAAAALAAGWYTGQRGASAPVAELNPSIGLRVTERGGFITAHWDPSSPLLRSGAGRRLEMTDGARQETLPLENLNTIISGEWTTRRIGKDVRVRFIASAPGGGPTTIETARYIGDDSIAGPAPAAGSAELDEARRKLATMEAELGRQIADNKRLESRVDLARRLLETRLAARVGETTPPPSPTATTPAPAPVTQPPPAPPKPVAPEPTPVATAPAPAPAPVSTPPPAAEPPRYSGPTSGRIIWTGFLAPNSTLTIDGTRASTGSVSSALPAAAARVSVYPAEISGGGLSVFTSNASRNNTTESRGARNGWMNTTFVFDADRARDVQVSQSPSAANPRQIQLRSGGRPVSAAVIEWQVAP